MTDAAPGRPPHPVRRRRRLRLQGAARRARAGAGRTCPAAARTGHRRVGELLVGLEHGDDGAAVRIDEGPDGRAVIATADFFTPVVDDAYDWGRIAAANALSDVYAMGGEPLLAVNLLAWPRDQIPFELAAEVLRGGADVACEAGTPPRRRAQHRRPGAEVRPGRHRLRPTPTGCCATTRPRPGSAADADQAARARGAQQPAQGHRRALRAGGRHDDHAQPRRLAGGGRRRASRPPPTSPASACSATSTRWPGPAASPRSSTPPPCPTSTARASRSPTGYVPGGSRRNLDWVRPHLDAAVDEDELVLLADAQTSGGLLVAGELPGSPGHRRARRGGRFPAGRPVRICRRMTSPDGVRTVRRRGEMSGGELGEQVRKTFLSWPVVRQLTGNDPLGRGTAARSAADRGSRPPAPRPPTGSPRSVCPYCAVGCGQKVFVKDEKVIQIEGDPDSPVSRGRLCPKGVGQQEPRHQPAAADQGPLPPRPTAPSGRTSSSTRRWR